MNLNKESLQHIVVGIFGICATLLCALGELSSEQWMYIALLIVGYTLKNGVAHNNQKKLTVHTADTSLECVKE